MTTIAVIMVIVNIQWGSIPRPPMNRVVPRFVIEWLSEWNIVWTTTNTRNEATQNHQQNESHKHSDHRASNTMSRIAGMRFYRAVTCVATGPTITVKTTTTLRS